MDPSSVLLALEELKKWRERHRRIRERMRQLDRRRATLRKELDGVRNHILASSRSLVEHGLAAPAVRMNQPAAPGRWQ